MHVENWPDDTQNNRPNKQNGLDGWDGWDGLDGLSLPKQPTRSNAGDSAGRPGSGEGAARSRTGDRAARPGGADEVLWPDAAGRTGSVPRQPTSGEQARSAPYTQSAAIVPPAPWEQPDEPGHNHDPHEVTVQLDGAGRELADGAAGAAKGATGTQESDGPVFVDESGRRRNRYRRLGIAVGTACAAYAAVIAGTLLSGNSDAPWLPVPMQKNDKPASEVDTSPLPAESADSGDDVDDTAEGRVPSGGAGSVRTGASSSPDDRSPGGSARGGGGEKPEASASAKPSKGPGAGPAPNPQPSVSAKDPEASPSTSPSPGGGDPSPSAPTSPPPSESSAPAPAPGSGDTDTVADGPASPAPVEPASTSSDAPSNPQDSGPQNPGSPA
ncbi:hypothetical protein [Streptomyces ipomoeae]|uniref:hypothetical protein n=1 Tax=Streptomyces ipomoeae TaxID=103232 RepID=UPI00215BE3A0|nr:hypothetical protein [Streptomyces ipomoeae]